MKEAAIDFDIAAYDHSISIEISGISFSSINPADYTHVLIICGPIWPELLYMNKLDRFSHCSFGGINLSIIGFKDISNSPFDLLISRDGLNSTSIDLSLFYKVDLLPLIGILLAPSKQTEYGTLGYHTKVESIIDEIIKKREYAFIFLDTKWPVWRNSCSIASPAEFESILSRVDLLITSRMHGVVFAVKNGIPIIAIDPIKGGAKVSEQARLLGVEDIYYAENITSEKLISSVRKRVSECDKFQRKVPLQTYEGYAYTSIVDFFSKDSSDKAYKYFIDNKQFIKISSKKPQWTLRRVLRGISKKIGFALVQLSEVFSEN